ncbi:DnaJ subfamily C member 27 [Cichlidogyrus casuarinus]|uniref:DnaJ subfamily C member 27 n=1 Tax=Cichlidogyrus casuarinus TaxID=1844966 RepID=A0ABD2QBJ2_9PLAT
MHFFEVSAARDQNIEEFFNFALKECVNVLLGKDPSPLYSNARETIPESPKKTEPNPVTLPRIAKVKNDMTEAQVVIKVLRASNHHDKLGVPLNACKDDINKAYKRLAFLLHPDKNGCPGSEEAFKQLVTARNTLLHNR